MTAAQITLSEANSLRVRDLSQRLGKSPDEVVNEAVEKYVAGEAPAWKAALMQAAGMWKDRDDIPELMAQLRGEWNRVEPPDNPEPL